MNIPPSTLQFTTHDSPVRPKRSDGPRAPIEPMIATTTSPSSAGVTLSAAALELSKSASIKSAAPVADPIRVGPQSTGAENAVKSATRLAYWAQSGVKTPGPAQMPVGPGTHPILTDGAQGAPLAFKPDTAVPTSKTDLLRNAR